MTESSHSQVFRDGLLEGLVCLVSGAGSGIGREASLELARLGATVVGCGRRAEPLAETAELAQDLPGAFDHEPLDIREEEPVDAFFDRLLERHGRLDVLLNNAGGQFFAPAESISPKGFRTVTELNVQGTWNMTHAAATKAFIPQNGGKVMSVTISPHNGMPGMVHSGAARTAIESMMRTLAIEWARFGVKTCSLALGHFETDVIRAKYPPEVVEVFSRTVPLGRAGRPEEVAWLVAYLASPAGDYFSGTTITIDGARDDWLGPWPPPSLATEEGGAVAEQRRAKDQDAP